METRMIDQFTAKSAKALLVDLDNYFLKDNLIFEMYASLANKVDEIAIEGTQQLFAEVELTLLRELKAYIKELYKVCEALKDCLENGQSLDDAISDAVVEGELSWGYNNSLQKWSSEDRLKIFDSLNKLVNLDNGKILTEQDRLSCRMAYEESLRKIERLCEAFDWIKPKWSPILSVLERKNMNSLFEGALDVASMEDLADCVKKTKNFDENIAYLKQIGFLPRDFYFKNKKDFVKQVEIMYRNEGRFGSEAENTLNVFNGKEEDEFETEMMVEDFTKDSQILPNQTNSFNGKEEIDLNQDQKADEFKTEKMVEDFTKISLTLPMQTNSFPQQVKKTVMEAKDSVVKLVGGKYTPEELHQFFLSAARRMQTGRHCVPDPVRSETRENNSDAFDRSQLNTIQDSTHDSRYHPYQPSGKPGIRRSKL